MRLTQSGFGLQCMQHANQPLHQFYLIAEDFALADAVNELNRQYCEAQTDWEVGEEELFTV